MKSHSRRSRDRHGDQQLCHLSNRARIRIEHLIATEPEEVSGEFTGRVLGVPSFREGKVTRLEAWLSERGLAWSSFEQTWFYSDSLNDIPLLSK